MKTTITPHDLAQLSPDAEARLWSWWDVALGDLYYDTETGEIEVAGDTGIYNCVAKDHGHYDTALPLLSISQLLQFLDDHGLYRDPKTGTTHLDGIPADQILDFLWSRVAARLEYGDDPEPLPNYVHVGVRQ